LMTLKEHMYPVECLTQLADGRIVSTSGEIKVWDTISGSSSMTLEGHFYASCVIQLTDGRLVSGSDDCTLRIWNIMSLSQQKWTRRRLLVLLFETSKILSEPPKQFEVICQEQYRRRIDLELLLRYSLNISNGIINLKAFKITITVLSMPEIAMLIAEYL